MAAVLKHLIISFCALVALCGAAGAEAVIDAGFAKTMIDKHADGGEDGYNQVLSALDGLSKDELAHLKALIREDMDAETGKIVSTVPMERRIAGRVLNAIDDRLGTLDYDLALEGRFLDFTGVGMVTYYYFRTDDGKITVVYVGSSTLLPHYGYDENYEDHVRVFVKRSEPAGYVAKIELTKARHSEIYESLHLKNCPDYLDLSLKDSEERP